ncbi:tripartite tricarboxylate transporter substrate binding protein [Verticiella sediminum]|uniref:Tripartite tricarboxylate transporter substrate binding protein n=2 Tax=Verticiella sediminum TaxID=1247510 RepID=A0A556AMX4_9BURK|nr:tripartite tricarboxylate transporter substrate binding protein [Verticiella sediminum]TSH94236.1 tripartite tricarboxylate transporter substrate binding protein [Verticiella sediminum]
MVPAHAADARPDAWPEKPMKFVVPYPPGGPLDVMARLLAEEVRDPLGQPTIIENRPGAGGNIGVGAVARSAPDGYTLVMGAVATFAINPWLFDNLPYDPIKDFTPITLVASVPNVLVVSPAFAKAHDIHTLDDLIRYAKANPGKLSYGSGGNGSAGHLAGELLKARSGIDAVHIPYGGAAPAQAALLGDQVHFMFDNLASAAPQIAAKALVPLAVTTTERAASLPDVPTVAQTLPGYDLGTWFGVFVPAGTPEPVVQRLSETYMAALKRPETRERLAQMGSDAQPNTPAEFADMVQKELAKYKEVVELSGTRL